MLNHPRSTKKNRGRSLIRDRDRTVTPLNSPRPEKDDSEVEKKDDEKEPKIVKGKPKEEKKKEVEMSDSSDDEQSEPTSSGQTGRAKRVEKKIKSEKVKVEKIEEQIADDKVSPDLECPAVVLLSQNIECQSHLRSVTTMELRCGHKIMYTSVFRLKHPRKVA